MSLNVSTADGRKRQVLVIDDDPVARATMSAILQDDGYTVTCAVDGKQGLNEFRKCRPDVVVTDIIMPEKEGIETILALRAMWPEGPIIAVSGGGRIQSADFLKMARALGASAVLAKPFEPQDLLSRIPPPSEECVRQSTSVEYRS